MNETKNFVVVDVIALHERHRRHRTLSRLTHVIDLDLLTNLTFHILAHHSVGTQPQSQADRDAKRKLRQQFQFGRHTILVATQLDLIVNEANDAEECDGGNQQHHIHIAQFTKEQSRHQHGQQDDHTTHRRHAFLLHSIRVDGCVARLLYMLLLTHILDEILTCHHRNDQRENQG